MPSLGDSGDQSKRDFRRKLVSFSTSFDGPISLTGDLHSRSTSDRNLLSEFHRASVA